LGQREDLLAAETQKYIEEIREVATIAESLPPAAMKKVRRVLQRLMRYVQQQGVDWKIFDQYAKDKAIWRTIVNR
jgi:hypothetical protein